MINSVALYSPFVEEAFARIVNPVDVKWVGCRPEYHGMSYEGYYVWLDSDDDGWNGTIFTPDVSERLYSVSDTDEFSVIRKLADWLEVRRSEDGTMQYKYDGVWYDAEKDEVCA